MCLCQGERGQYSRLTYIGWPITLLLRGFDRRFLPAPSCDHPAALDSSFSPSLPFVASVSKRCSLPSPLFSLLPSGRLVFEGRLRNFRFSQLTRRRTERWRWPRTDNSEGQRNARERGKGRFRPRCNLRRVFESLGAEVEVGEKDAKVLWGAVWHPKMGNNESRTIGCLTAVGLWYITLLVSSRSSWDVRCLKELICKFNLLRKFRNQFYSHVDSVTFHK